MNSRTLALVAVLLLWPAASAQAQTKLEWKFKEGTTFHAERIYTQKQTVEVKGKGFQQDAANTWLIKVDVKDKKRDHHTLAITLEEVSYKSQGPKTQAAFDNKMAQKMKGIGFTVQVTPQGKIQRLEGYEAFVKKLAEGNMDVEKVLRLLVSEDGVKEGIEEIFAVLPERAVKKGDVWKRGGVDPVPPFGAFKTQIEYKLDEEKDDQTFISSKIATTFELGKPDADLFRVIKGGLTGDEGKGSYVFDQKAGRLVRGEKTMTVRGDLTIEATGNQTTMKFVSENKLQVRVFEKEKEKEKEEK